MNAETKHLINLLGLHREGVVAAWHGDQFVHVILRGASKTLTFDMPERWGDVDDDMMRAWEATQINLYHCIGKSDCVTTKRRRTCK
jgi:hypothetical protein